MRLVPQAISAVWLLGLVACSSTPHSIAGPQPATGADAVTACRIVHAWGANRKVTYLVRPSTAKDFISVLLLVGNEREFREEVAQPGGFPAFVEELRQGSLDLKQSEANLGALVPGRAADTLSITLVAPGSEATTVVSRPYEELQREIASSSSLRASLDLIGRQMGKSWRIWDEPGPTRT
jgi:hypothetical protein